jgi:hypothetical protein
MALRMIETERRCLTDALTAAWDSCPGLVYFEDIAGDEVLSGFPRKSWNWNLKTWLSIFKDSWWKS